MGSGPASVLPAAALAGVTSTTILHPLEVVRSRITCDRAGRYSAGVAAALGGIVRQEGPVALYGGLGSSLAAIIPEAAITYGRGPEQLDVIPSMTSRASCLAVHTADGP